MTDTTQGLDEIMERLRLWYVTDNPKALRSLNDLEAKQAVLDWHNKQVKEVLDRLQQTVIEEYCLDEAQHEIVMNVFEAERKRLKGESDG